EERRLPDAHAVARVELGLLDARLVEVRPVPRARVHDEVTALAARLDLEVALRDLGVVDDEVVVRHGPDGDGLVAERVALVLRASHDDEPGHALACIRAGPERASGMDSTRHLRYPRRFED